MDTSGLRSSERTGATNGAETAQAAGADVGAAGGPTAAQLRRRFELNGDLDEVCQIDGPDGARIFVGLPPRESKFLADLARDGDIGLELSNDPRSPIVVGVYPIRPVSRG